MDYIYLTLIRHGQTEANKTHIVQGQFDSRLSEEGLNQANQLAKSINPSDYNLIYSSDLNRAYNTCLKVVNDDEKLIKTDLRLRERCMGNCEGKPFEFFRECAKNDGVLLKNLSFYTPSGGETPKQVKERVKGFYNNLIKEIQSGWKVLIITHVGIIRESLRYFNEDLKCDFHNLHPFIITPNTGVNEIKLYYKDGQLISAECIRLHDVSHLNEHSKSIVFSEEQINDNNADDSKQNLL